MRKVEILSDIKHAAGLYLKGETRIVDDPVANYFIANGWARDQYFEARKPSTSAVTLEVQEPRHGHKSPGVK